MDLTIRAGELVAVHGTSGSGKSTLLALLGLLDRPSGGTLLLAGSDVSQVNDRQRTLIRRTRIGFVFQQHYLVEHKTVLDNVAMGVSVGDRRDRRAAARQALADVGLSHRQDFLPRYLSGGERQRSVIARSLVRRPSLILADEPTGNLDRRNRDGVLDLLDAARRRPGTAVIVVTHDTDVAARADRAVQLEDGVIVPGHAPATRPAESRDALD